MKHYTTFIFVLILFTGCKNSVSEKTISNKVVINGDIIHLSKNNRTVRIDQDHIIYGKVTNRGIADSTGYFRIELVVDYPQTVLLKYGNNTRLYCEPGDSINVKLDGDIYSNYLDDMPNDKYFVREVSGDNAMTNKCIIDFLRNDPDRKDNYKQAYKQAYARENYTPNEYKIFLEQRDSIYISYYNNFIKENKVTPIFKSYAKDYIHYMRLHDLMMYPKYPRKNKKKKIILPDDYYSFLEEYDMDDSDLLSRYHTSFVNLFYSYYFETREIKQSEISEAWHQKDTKKLFDVNIKSIETKASGFTRDLLVTILFTGEYRGWPAYFDSTVVKTPYLKTIIHDLEKKNQEKTIDKKVNLTSIRDGCNAHIIDEIINAGKGKVMYLEFWAPWCKPCLNEMSFMKDIHKEFDSSKIEFVYLCCKSTREASKKVIEKYNLQGTFIDLTTEEYDNLFSKFGIVGGLPSYAILNQKEEIVTTKAPRPSDHKRLKEILEKVIK